MEVDPYIRTVETWLDSRLATAVAASGFGMLGFVTVCLVGPVVVGVTGFGLPLAGIEPSADVVWAMLKYFVPVAVGVALIESAAVYRAIRATGSPLFRYAAAGLGLVPGVVVPLWLVGYALVFGMAECLPREHVATQLVGAALYLVHTYGVPALGLGAGLAAWGVGLLREYERVADWLTD